MGETIYNDYQWKFDEKVSETFDSHVRQSVHMYDEFQNSIADISKFFTYDGTNVLDIGTSTGSLLDMVYQNNSFRKCDFIGIDIEDAMVRKAVEKHKHTPMKFYHADFLKFDIDNCSVITLMLVLQFIPHHEKQRFMQKIYNSLNDGGVFFFVDKVKTSVIDIHDIYNDLYYDFKIDNGLSYEEVIKKNMALRGVQKTMTINENLDLLNGVGFTKTDIFLKFNNFVGIVCIK